MKTRAGEEVGCKRACFTAAFTALVVDQVVGHVRAATKPVLLHTGLPCSAQAKDDSKSDSKALSHVEVDPGLMFHKHDTAKQSQS